MKSFVLSLVMGLAVFMPLAGASAVTLFPDASGTGQDMATTMGLSADKSLAEIIASIINIVLSVLGVVLVVLIIYAGIKWMTSSDEKGVGDAKKILMNAIVGLVIIVAAWAITSFVVSSIMTSVGDTGGMPS
jgi:heme/copper-type cytochrome/quinol oxidase subunit 2